MHTQRIHEVLAEAIVGRHLLAHPFYRRWEAGTLSEGELAAYAEQYRHIERELPVTLTAIASALPQGRARELVEANLRRRARVAGASRGALRVVRGGGRCRARGAATPSTAALLALVRTAAANDPAAALAMVAAYEIQAADIAGSKSDGLRRLYGFDEDGTRFWDVHRTQEVDHAGWSLEALSELGADPDVVQAAATVSADSWWLFLSEREELAPAVASA